MWPRSQSAKAIKWKQMKVNYLSIVSSKKDIQYFKCDIDSVMKETKLKINMEEQ